jgi:ribonuclease BN (tRNA processing enzyme)
VPFAYALTYAPRQQPVPVDRWPGTDSPARPILHAPPGARDTFRRVVGSWGNEDLIEKAFDLREYDPSDELEIGPVRIRFQSVPHFTETFAMRISSQNGSGRIVYGADCSPTEKLTDFASDADLILVEATLPRPERTGVRGHLTASEAGEHARAAGAKRLLLVHISDELDASSAKAAAEDAFGGPVQVAAGGAVYDV